MRKSFGVFFLFFGLGLSAGNSALAITVDGSLSDWGLSNQWTPTDNNNDSGFYRYNNLTINYTVEDYIGGNGGQVYPGYGGQDYDAEALYLTWDDTNLYIALVTGHYPKTETAGSSFGPGDFALAFWNGNNVPQYTYGIETTGNDGLNKGGIYQVTSWSKSPYYWDGVTHITSIATGTSSHAANLKISDPVTGIGAGPSSDKHWIYELSAPLSAFGDINGKKLSVYWTMNCANDMIEVDPPLHVDEPPVWALLGLTLPAVFWRRRRSER